MLSTNFSRDQYFRTSTLLSSCHINKTCFFCLMLFSSEGEKKHKTMYARERSVWLEWGPPYRNRPRSRKVIAVTRKLLPLALASLGPSWHRLMSGVLPRWRCYPTYFSFESVIDRLWLLSQVSLLCKALRGFTAQRPLITERVTDWTLRSPLHVFFTLLCSDRRRSCPPQRRGLSFNTDTWWRKTCSCLITSLSQWNLPLTLWCTFNLQQVLWMHQYVL